MLDQHQLGLLTGAVAINIIAAQPLQAASTQVTDIQIESNTSGIELRLQTLGEQENPLKIFTISRGNDFVADIIDTQLKLQGSKKFRQENPISGIASIEVKTKPMKIKIIIPINNSDFNDEISQAVEPVLTPDMTVDVENIS
ncbi:MAG: AMIN domain-containing protein, partial [Moorea sp. SIO2B7]|nr:AMIN domain-containing protein [Moorena sp. SIO2B7]